MVDDRNAAALRALLNGSLPAKEISALVGWAPRTAGPKLHALERAGLVRKRESTGEGETTSVRWALTRKGWEIVGHKQLPTPTAAGGAEVPPAPAESAGEAPCPSEPTTGQVVIGPTRLGKQKGSVAEVIDAIEAAHPGKAGNWVAEGDDGPWPSLRAREGGVDPEVSASLSLSGWLFLLRAAHSGASAGSRLTRKRVEAELQTLEAQLELRWCNGRYETSDGTTVTPEKLAYLKHQL